MLSVSVCTTSHWQTSGRLVQEFNACTALFGISWLLQTWMGECVHCTIKSCLYLHFPYYFNSQTEPLVGVLKPAVMTKATDWLKSASDEEREIVMKALRIGHNGKVDQTLRRTLQPNVKHSVESSAQTATDKGLYNFF